MQDIFSTQIEHEIKAVSLWPFYLGLFNRTEFLHWYHITKYQNPIFLAMSTLQRVKTALQTKVNDFRYAIKENHKTHEDEYLYHGF